jgi:hypothetical protein
MNLLEELLPDLFVNLPALVTISAVFMMVLASAPRHPPAARWALLGFGWLFLTYLLSIFWRTIGLFLIFPHAQQFGPEEIISLLLLSICESLAYIFLLAALFVARKPYRPPHFYEDSDDDILRRHDG